jgi:hypothetical protein
VDRLDTWLNAQRGWRRLLLMIATWYASTLLLCCCAWMLSTSDFALPALDATVIAILAIPATICLGSAMAANYARGARNPRRKKGQPPFFMWRTAVGLWLIPFYVLIGFLSPFRAHHRTVFVLEIILVGGYLLLVAETRRYTDRFTRPRADYLPENMI